MNWKLFIALLFPAFGLGQHSFDVVPLGIRGGLDESNLSAYMIAAAGSQNFVCADAGTLRAGIFRANALKTFGASDATVLKSYIKAYFISHGHLDHLSGLIINSPDDTAKAIYAMPYVLDVLKDKYFSWQSWANFGDQGEKPALGKYHYATLDEGKEVSVAGTLLRARAFELAHSSPYKSTAFLFSNGESYLLYFGDTGSDRVENSDKLARVWSEVSPLVKARKLKAIFIEVSYTNAQPEKQLFGHLTPKLLLEELAKLGAVAGEKAIRGLPVVVTHIKPAPGVEAAIKRELAAGNNLHVKFVFPEQGKRLSF